MKKDLLVVDDEPALCNTLGTFFTRKGFKVTTANTAREALDRARKVNADVVLLDLKLPDGSGLEVLSTLKEQFPSLRIVVISALADALTVQEAFQRGASDYLPKPFDFDRCFYAAMGIETVDLTLTCAKPEALAKVPPALARRYQVLPLRLEKNTLCVAMADPLDPRRLEELSAAFSCPITPIAVIAGDLPEAIRRDYQAVIWKPREIPRTAALPESSAADAPQGTTPLSGADPLISALVHHAYTNRAMAIHIGTDHNGPWVRERIDGVLSDVSMRAPLKGLYRDLVLHLKKLAHLDVAQQALPQQGRIRFESGAIKLDLDISIVPTAREEHVVIRLLEPSHALELEQLGFIEEQQSALLSLLAKPSGLLLVTGPSGSGSSATLYACLSKLNTGHVNIVTIEDPVEHELPGVTQIPVQARAGLTFADGLRAVPYHDPNVVMVGELQDQETAGLAVRMALAGHLVLSRLHTQDASSAITRLLDLGIEPFFLCSTLSGILSQRLIRKLCAACREPYVVDAASLSRLQPPFSKASGAVSVWRAKGCKRCRNTGYHGRTGIFELLVIDHQIRSLIIKRTSGSQIRQSAISRGMVSLPQALWQKVQSGVTGLEELTRHLSLPSLTHQ